jgi:cysteine sulfinate desulfinase/cysteine desulfurase-like protein
MNLHKDYIDGALRFSFSLLNQPEEIDYCIEQLVPAYEKLKKISMKQQANRSSA